MSNDTKEKIDFLRYFLIDYENVNHNGLDGITKLTEDDCVKIYYSKNAETLTFGLHRRINESKAKFVYHRIQMPIKNAVDCQILLDVRELIKTNRDAEFFIVSNDTDYDQAIKEFTSRKYKIKRILSINKREESILEEQQKTTVLNSQPKKTASKITKEKREAQIRSFFGKHFKKPLYTEKKEEIIQILITSTTRQQVNNKLMKLYSNETVSSMLKTLQPLIKDLSGR